MIDYKKKEQSNEKLILHLHKNLLDTLNIASYNLCLHNILVVNSNRQSVPLPLLFDLPIQFDILLDRCLLDDYTNTLFHIVNDCESVYLMICDEQIVKQLLV